jgi:hypothetical protein
MDDARVQAAWDHAGASSSLGGGTCGQNRGGGDEVEGSEGCLVFSWSHAVGSVQGNGGEAAATAGYALSAELLEAAAGAHMALGVYRTPL